MRSILIAMAVLIGGAGAARAELEAELVGGERAPDGRLLLRVPFEGPVGLSIRLTNRGEEPVQVVLSSFPFHFFTKAVVTREGAGEPIPPHPDLYPLKDMKAPAKVYRTLAPGESATRSLDVLIREGYGLATFADSGWPRHFTDLRAEGYGALNEPGPYELVGTWSPDPTRLDGTPHDVFSDVRGRDESIPVAGAVRTEPLVVEIRHRHDFDALSRWIASSRHVVTGEVERIREPSVTGAHGGYATFRAAVDRTLAGPEVERLRYRVYLPAGDAAVAAATGRKLLFLLEAEGALYPVDEESVVEPHEELLAEVESRVRFQRWLLLQPLRIDAGTKEAVDALVERLVESPAAQADALQALEAMGDRAVRALVPHLEDDRRPAAGTVSFLNRAPDRFEAVRHYGVKTVGEAVARLLNQVTGEHFETAEGWRVYARSGD